MIPFTRQAYPQLYETGDQSLVQHVPQLQTPDMSATAKALSDVGELGMRIKQEVDKAHDARHLIEADGGMNEIERSVLKMQQPSSSAIAKPCAIRAVDVRRVIESSTGNATLDGRVASPA